MTKIKTAILGASGYTGADLARLLLCHPNADIVALSANAHAGKAMAEVYPHLRGQALPVLQKVEEISWDGIDAVFCALPHATTQQIVKDLPERLKVIDLSADFRLRDAATYAEWYGHEHFAPELQAHAAYGLTEHYRDAIKAARLVACPGCYPTATLLALLPLVKAGLIESDDLIIDAKSGASGAGRALKDSLMFCEVAEGMHPYAVASHRHAPEIEQELGAASGAHVGQDVIVNFTPHLVPMNRGELVTIYARAKTSAVQLRRALNDVYGNEPFIRILREDEAPATRHVRGSNFCDIAVFDDRIKGRVIIAAAIDNLVKGSSGQAIQNFNLMFGIDETTGLKQLPLFP